jgi:hypothetical protein
MHLSLPLFSIIPEQQLYHTVIPRQLWSLLKFDYDASSEQSDFLEIE